MIDFMNTNSTDIPYEDTTYKAHFNLSYYGTSSTEGTHAIVTHSVINCNKVLLKRYGDTTYYKVEIQNGVVITSEEPIELVIEREDGYQLVIKEKITSNIVSAETVKYKWFKWDLTKQDINGLGDAIRDIPFTYPGIQLYTQPVRYAIGNPITTTGISYPMATGSLNGTFTMTSGSMVDFIDFANAVTSTNISLRTDADGDTSIIGTIMGVDYGKN